MAQNTVLNIENLQLRGDTASNWNTVNPVLAVNEMGIERDTRKFKFGDGISTWKELPYVTPDPITVDAILDALSENPIQNKAVYEELRYTNDTPVITAIGGIAAGTTFSDVPVIEMLTKLIYPYTKPAVSISVTPNGGTYEKGLSVKVTALKATVTRKSSDIASVVAKQGSTAITTLTSNVSKGGTFDLLPSGGVTVTSNVSFSATATDVDGGSTSVTGGTFAFVDPYYYGVVAEGTAITSDVVKALTKDIKGKGTKTYKYTTNNSCMVIAYPASYGVLKSALDPNNFENIGSYTQNTVTVSCESGDVSYYVYVKTPSSVTDFNIKYSY